MAAAMILSTFGYGRCSACAQASTLRYPLARVRPLRVTPFWRSAALMSALRQSSEVLSGTSFTLLLIDERHYS